MGKRGDVMNELFNMGGYGWYVWPAYGITLVVFALNMMMSYQENRKIKKIIQNHLLK